MWHSRWLSHRHNVKCMNSTSFTGWKNPTGTLTPQTIGPGEQGEVIPIRFSHKRLLPPFWWQLFQLRSMDNLWGSLQVLDPGQMAVVGLDSGSSSQPYLPWPQTLPSPWLWRGFIKDLCTSDFSINVLSWYMHKSSTGMTQVCPYRNEIKTAQCCIVLHPSICHWVPVKSFPYCLYSNCMYDSYKWQIMLITFSADH